MHGEMPDEEMVRSEPYDHFADEDLAGHRRLGEHGDRGKGGGGHL